MNVSEAIIRRAISERRVNDLAFFYLVKTRYVNSIVYDYTPRKLAKEFGVSVNSVKKYITWLSEQTAGCWYGHNYRTHKIVYMVGNDLHFMRIQPKKHTTKFKKGNYTLRQLKNILYGKIIESMITAQKNQVKQKRDIKRIIHNPKPSEAKLYKKYVRDYYNREVTFNETVSMSVRGICSSLGISMGKLEEVIARLEKSKAIKRKKQKKFFLKRDDESYLKVNSDNFDLVYSNIKAEFKFCALFPYKGRVLVCPPTVFSICKKHKTKSETKIVSIFDKVK